jgi:N-acetylglucosamine-6-phosphate deacetylase
MKCFGFDVFGGGCLEVTGGDFIESVEAQLAVLEGSCWLAPGWIDIQVNGFAGADYCSAGTPLDAIERSLQAQFSTGVTRLFPTVITGARDEMLGALRNLAEARRMLPHGRAMEAFHVEGPHISPHDGPRGAHPVGHVRPPDVDEFRRWQEAAEGNIRLVTLSPEWPEAPAYVEALTAQGVVVSLGHMDATAEQIEACVRAGATLSTHLGNGAHAVLPRHPNYLWTQLAEDRLGASFIVDCIHLGASFLRTALRAKGIERSVLITDAVMPACCAPGRYKLGEVDVELHAEGNVTLLGGTRLAGSALRMDRGIENLMRIAGLTLAEAVTMATRNPARLGRIAQRQRGLLPGERADVVEFSFDESSKRIGVLRTWLDGELVFEAK